MFKCPGSRSYWLSYNYNFAGHPWKHKIPGKGHEILSYLHESISTCDLDKYMK